MNRFVLGSITVQVVMMVMLGGCVASSPAPIEDRRSPARVQDPREFYTVSSGDTLYSIAFRFGLDYRDLAQINGIVAPYFIYPGERILVRGADKALPENPSTAVAVSPVSDGVSRPAPGQVIVRPALPSGSEISPASPSGPVLEPQRRPQEADDSASAAAVMPDSPPVTKRSAAPTAPSGPVSRWQWPSSGGVSRSFSASVHKGIDIEGQRGDPVLAAAAGEVVYAGTGIVGFGELIIIKHDDIHLSAYGHNDRLLVREGDTVVAGEKIAEKGDSGTDSVKLHFEIRREGRPVDPLGLLPGR